MAAPAGAATGIEPRPRRARGGALELARFGADPLRYLDGLRGDGRDVVPFRLGTVRCRLLASPELLWAVLESEDWPPLSRGRLAALDLWYSGGLILTEGAEHHRQRDVLWRPLVDGTALEQAGARAARRAESWEDGAELRLFGELRSLVKAIDWEALTGEDLDAAPELLRALDRGVAASVWLLGPFGRGRWNAPLPGSMQARTARRRLDAAIDRLIAERRTGGGEDGLARLVQAGADDALIRATVKQWLGADQLHGALVWALHLLAGDPDAEARWHAELDAVLGGRPASVDDLPALSCTRNVILEAMRLFPPIWGFFRLLTADYELGGETVPAGEVLVLSQWFTHRDPRLWPDPLRFDPERWSEDAERPEPGSYFPYSSGPYGCPAHDLSLSQAVLVLATLGSRWSFRPAGKPPKPVARGIVVPAKGLPVKLERRS